jgi:THO complex subunit 2
MIEPVVDSFRYLGAFSLDVFQYLILESLATPRSKMATDGIGISSWLDSISTLTALLYRRFGLNMRAIVMYVHQQLISGDSVDLIVLNRIIAKMAGIESVEETSDEQVCIALDRASPHHRE